MTQEEGLTGGPGQAGYSAGLLNEYLRLRPRNEEVLLLAPEEDVIDEGVEEEQQPAAQDPAQEVLQFAPEEDVIDEAVGQEPEVPAPPQEEEQQPAAHLPPAGNLDFLAYDEQFQNLRAAVQPALLQYLEATPHANQIRQRPGTFLGLLAEPLPPQPQPQRNNLEEVDLGGTSQQDVVHSIPAEDRVSIPSKGKEKILLIGESSSAAPTWQEGLTEQKGESSSASYDAQAPGAGPTPSGSSAMTGFPDAKPETVDKECQIPDDSAVSGESKFSALGADSLDTDTRARRTNISFGNSASASARDDSLHSVTKFSENSCRKTDQDGPAAEQQLNSDAGQVATQSEPQNAGYIDPEVLAATPDVEDANTVPEKKKASESETSSGESQAEMRRPPDRGTTSTAETSKKKKKKKNKKEDKDKRQADEDMDYLEQQIQNQIQQRPQQIKIRDIEEREGCQLGLTVFIDAKKVIPKKGEAVITVCDDTGSIYVHAKGSEVNMVEGTYMRLTYAETSFDKGGHLILQNVRFEPVDRPGWKMNDDILFNRSIEADRKALAKKK